MSRKPIRDMVTIEEVSMREPGWYEDLLYDGDFYALQDNVELDKDIKSYLFLIYPSGVKEKDE